MTLKEGDNPVAWAVDGAQFPNFTLTSTRMWQNEFDQARLDIQVERDLRVTVTPAKPVVGPGEPVELDVTTVDQLGRPVAAELSIAMVDQSLLRLFSDRLPAIGPFFYDQTRTGAFSTEATNTFRYEPEHDAGVRRPWSTRPSGRRRWRPMPPTEADVTTRRRPGVSRWATLSRR